MITLFLLLIQLSIVYGRVDMLSSDLEELKKHPMKAENVTADQLQWVITEEWMKFINDECENLDAGARISAFFDYTLVGTNTLAWASYTAILIDGVWTPAIATTDYSGYDFIMGVNPEPPNGWHIEDNCDNIGYRYDLRTVLRHEMIHGLGVGSSITKNGVWRVGYNFEGNCYPTKYDTLIKDYSGNNVVEGCTLKQELDDTRLYVNGVRLYNPSTFSQGSSISHHTYPDELMFWRLPAMKCISLGVSEIKMLEALDIPCLLNPNYSSAATRARYQSFLGLVSIPLMIALYYI